MINVVDVKQASLSDVYVLIQKIYASTDSMANSFEQAFGGDVEFGSAIARIEKNPGSFLLIAQENSQAVGYFWLKARSEEKLRHTADFSMGVASSHRGRAVGALLLSEAIARVTRERRIEILYLMVREDNAAAVRLYLKSDFEIVARLERDTKIGDSYFTGLLMRKFLAP